MIPTESILNTAKYLRNIRPVDPDEMQEYVDGNPHPGVIRQTLRDHAVDLALREREDGLFVPVEDGPIEAIADRPTELPPKYVYRLEELLITEYGVDWAQGESGDQLRRTIRALKDAYYRQEAVEYNYTAALAYAIYHLPDYYAVTYDLLRELVDNRLLDRTLRILDVGAGVGGPAIGLSEILPDDVVIDYTAVEPSEATTVLEEMLAETHRNFHSTVQHQTAEELTLESEYDLVLFSNVLSELDDPHTTVKRYLDALATDGTMVLTAPADKNTSQTLRSVEQSVANGEITVFSPTVRLWPDESPSDDCWSFKELPEIAAPSVQEALEQHAHDEEHSPGEFLNTTVKYSYALLRKDGKTRLPTGPDPSEWIKFRNSERHVGNRVNCLAVKLSNNLSEGGNPLFRIGDGSQQADHFAVVPKQTQLNRDLIEASYASLLMIESGLVLWNDDEKAYNIIIDGESVVDRMAV